MDRTGEWERIEAPDCVEAHHKMFGDGPDVLVRIRRTSNGYEVSCSAESRTAGPNDTIVGLSASLPEAQELSQQEQQRWDEDMSQSAPSLRGLRLVR